MLYESFPMAFLTEQVGLLAVSAPLPLGKGTGLLGLISN